jgi:hypothetical protein
VTALEPAPLTPELIVIQLTPEDASQAQSVAEAVKSTPPAPPDAPNDWAADEMAKPQVAPACVTVRVWPAIVSVPVRGWLLVLASTE